MNQPHSQEGILDTSNTPKGPLQADIRRGNVLELEVTTRCNLRCPPCARVVFEDTWVHSDMSRVRFNHILHHAARFETIYFRGWGEPLMHPRFPEMLHAIQTARVRVVVSTNGIVPFPEELLPLVHLLEFRMGCGDARVFENQHPGRRFNTVLFNIARVCLWKLNHGTNFPKIRLQFTKNRFTLHRLQDYIELAGQFKPVQVQLSQPGFHVREIDEAGVLPGDIPDEEMRRIDTELEEIAREEGVDLVQAENEGHCLFNPIEHIFVNWKGQISPCKYTLPPVADQHFTVYNRGRIHDFRCVDLANSARPFDFSKWHLKVRNKFTPSVLHKESSNGSNTLPAICSAICSNVQT